MRNVAFRAGTSSAARRVSGGSAGRGSVKRASSLGGGFGGEPFPFSFEECVCVLMMTGSRGTT